MQKTKKKQWVNPEKKALQTDGNMEELNSQNPQEKPGDKKIYKFSCMINSVVVLSYPRQLTLKI